MMGLEFMDRFLWLIEKNFGFLDGCMISFRQINFIILQGMVKDEDLFAKFKKYELVREESIQF